MLDKNGYKLSEGGLVQITCPKAKTRGLYGIVVKMNKTVWPKGVPDRVKVAVIHTIGSAETKTILGHPGWESHNYWFAPKSLSSKRG